MQMHYKEDYQDFLDNCQICCQILGENCSQPLETIPFQKKKTFALIDLVVLFRQILKDIWKLPEMVHR